ncbi:hypothetical protein [Dendronalium sp. ChiSLP03b]|uniref:hypothetical protein n=1 Tax=Dendronalium sp. ChiSLP03b TaxID=3075381 RepID=UPI002AD5515A|nr:hypothetical protein [Dendronalium sp. ChiSLP03b]MDZ8202769.1 hypothetical protein [Dendronalium sp. ChiSLP03b]
MQEVYYVENNSLRLRAATDLPPTGTRMDSLYDKDTRYGNKRGVTWTGYKVHLTETCDEDSCLVTRRTSCQETNIKICSTRYHLKTFLIQNPNHL